MAQGRLILDSGALSALAEGDPRMRAWVTIATKKHMLLGIPAPVLAETITGRATDARVYRVIPANASVLDTTGAIGREAGRIRYRAKRTAATVDALIVATAAMYHGSILLTGDPDDLLALGAQLDAGSKIQICAI